MHGPPPTHFRPHHRPPACWTTPAGPLASNAAFTSAWGCVRPAEAGSYEGARRGACAGSAGSSGPNAGLGGAAGHCRRPRRSACPPPIPRGGWGGYMGLWGGGGVSSHVNPRRRNGRGGVNCRINEMGDQQALPVAGKGWPRSSAPVLGNSGRVLEGVGCLAAPGKGVLSGESQGGANVTILRLATLGTSRRQDRRSEGESAHLGCRAQCSPMYW